MENGNCNSDFFPLPSNQSFSSHSILIPSIAVDSQNEEKSQDEATQTMTHDEIYFEKYRQAAMAISLTSVCFGIWCLSIPAVTYSFNHPPQGESTYYKTGIVLALISIFVGAIIITCVIFIGLEWAEKTAQCIAESGHAKYVDCH